MLTRRHMLVALALAGCSKRTSQQFTTGGSAHSGARWGEDGVLITETSSPDLVAVHLGLGFDRRLNVQLYDNGAFEFALNGNAPSLIPRPEIGFWKGTDPVRVTVLQHKWLEGLKPSRSSYPLLPDTPTLSISRVQNGKSRMVSFVPGQTPAEADAALQHTLQLVNGPWRSARWKTLDVMVVPRCNRPEVLIDLRNTGAEPVTIPSPLQRWVCGLDLSVDPNKDPPFSYATEQLRVQAQPAIPRSWRTQRAAAPLVNLPVGSHIGLSIAPISPPPAGRYDAYIRLRLLAQLSHNDSRDLVQGTLFVGPMPWLG
ncbi:MAG: hypothetical protein JW940_04360 [Polyangiaceae bacterium]|nr:hypothetical protein [Polyangiaceae bacterium]